MILMMERAMTAWLGGKGNDILTGVAPGAANLGVGQLDTLIGGAGIDLFTLGTLPKFYVNNANHAAPGTGDYTLIVDFDFKQDVMQLYGSASNYRLDASTVRLPAVTAIFQKVLGQNELIGVV